MQLNLSASVSVEMNGLAVRNVTFNAAPRSDRAANLLDLHFDAARAHAAAAPIRRNFVLANISVAGIAFGLQQIDRILFKVLFGGASVQANVIENVTVSGQASRGAQLDDIFRLGLTVGALLSIR
jgi:hypothetical protein